MDKFISGEHEVGLRYAEFSHRADDGGSNLP
jgi:hypothetical protein